MLLVAYIQQRPKLYSFIIIIPRPSTFYLVASTTRFPVAVSDSKAKIDVGFRWRRYCAVRMCVCGRHTMEEKPTCI